MNHVGPLRKKWGVELGYTFTPEEWQRHWNGMLDDFARLVPRFDIADGIPKPITFPWKTSALRFAPPTDPTNPLTWQINVAVGTVNDSPPKLIYKAKDDPRGWTPDPPPASDASPIIERSLSEWDAPWLLFTAPKPGADATTSNQFVKVPDTARPAFFKTVEMWDLDLYQASVYLSDILSEMVSPDFPLNMLNRLKRQIRLLGGRQPSAVDALAGAVLELARLYLLRDPDDEDGSGDKILVRQEVFYCVRGELLVPNNPAANYGDAGPYGNLELAEIAALYAAGAQFAWWTC